MIRQQVLWIALATTVAIGCALIAAPSPEKDLVGTYRLVSDTQKILETGEVLYPYGKHPAGYIMYGKEGFAP
jgi:hypothetical protein